MVETDLTKKVDLALELLTNYLPITQDNKKKIENLDFRINIVESIVKDKYANKK